MEKVIDIKNLVKSYGKVSAVNNISFDVDKGSLFAFLGTNGAGKSTVINILATLITKNSGKVFINGWDLDKNNSQIREEIGVVFQNGVLDNLLTVKENLIVRGSFYNIDRPTLKDRIQEVSKITGCCDFIDRRYGELSGGQKRRSDIARALINKPKILFLDEPTTGLDPQTRSSIWETISNMQRELGTTIFLTTHYMEEAANADKIIIIDKGEIIKEGTPHLLKNKFTKDVLKIYEPNNNVIEYCNKKNVNYSLNKSIMIVEIKNVKEIIGILKDLEDEIISFEILRGNLDDVFLNVIQEKREKIKCLEN